MFGIASHKGPLVMGVLNVTPDSFSDGGRNVEVRAWHAAIDAMITDGADVIDVGGESTRPGSVAVPAEVQIERILEPVLYAVRALGTQGTERTGGPRGERTEGSEGSARDVRGVVSVDTTLPEVARAALEAGARIVNDVSCLADEGLAREVARADAWLVIMHSRGAMSAMSGFSATRESAYDDVVAEVRAELADACARAIAAGVNPAKIGVDPGLGFHKSASHSYALLRGLAGLRDVSPGMDGILVGASRKSFLARDVVAPPTGRTGGSIAAALAAVAHGADAIRVHDVLETRQAVAVARASGLLGEGDRPYRAGVPHVG